MSSLKAGRELFWLASGIKEDFLMKTVPSKAADERKPGKNEFKCFECRSIYSSKDGDWFAWNSMEVHLCRGCDKDTQNRPERSKG
jgi:hypothetical protein